MAVNLLRVFSPLTIILVIELLPHTLEVALGSMLQLSLDYIRHVSYNTCMAIGNISRKLTSLDISSCEKVTDDELLYIVNGWQSLKFFICFGNIDVSHDFPTRHLNRRLIMYEIGGRGVWWDEQARSLSEPNRVRPFLQYSRLED